MAWARVEKRLARTGLERCWSADQKRGSSLLLGLCERPELRQSHGCLRVRQAVLASTSAPTPVGKSLWLHLCSCFAPRLILSTFRHSSKAVFQPPTTVGKVVEVQFTLAVLNCQAPGASVRFCSSSAGFSQWHSCQNVAAAPLSFPSAAGLYPFMNSPGVPLGLGERARW